jgi:serine/threonine protein kinase
LSDRTGQLLGNYKLVRLLGQGGFSDVYLGEHVHLGTYAAIKILRTQLADDGIENFRMEARTLAHLKHPNIVQVLEFGVESMVPYLVMEYAPNDTLRQRHPRNVPVPVNVIVPYVKQVAAALQYAHNQKLIHRDIKPENMLVGEQNHILLSDFGIAVVTASARAANPMMSAGASSWDPAGTVSYMAPEQIQGKTVPASDQYGLAIVVYEWLSGTLPFKGPYMEVVSQQIAAVPPSLRDKVPSLPPDVEQVLLIALNKDPQQRFGRIEAFANALEAAAQTGSVVPTLPPRSSVPLLSKNASEVSTMEAALTGPLGRFALGTTKVTVGRAPDNMLVLNDTRVSSHHAEIRPEGQFYNLVDLGSTNGTFINEQQATAQVPRRLQPGDIVRFGDTKYTFDAGSSFQGRYPTSDGSTVRGTPPPQGAIPPVGAQFVAPNPASGNTSYGMGSANYDGQAYQETIISQSSSPYTPQQQQPSYTPPMPPQPPQQQQPLVLGGQPSSYNNPSSYGASGAIPAYSPQQPPSPPMYTSPQQPPSPPMFASPQRAPFQQTPQPTVYPPPTPQPAPKKRSLWLTIVLALVALLVIVGAVGGFLIRNNQIAQDNTNATATSQSQTQALARTHATATANARASATASANLTATAVVTSHFPPFTNLAFHDALTTDNAQWPSSSICQFSSSGYQISIAQAGTFESCSPTTATKYTDFAFQVTMTIKSGDCGGLLFRVVDKNNFYIVLICSDGTYDLGDFLNNKPSWATDLAKRSSSSTIRQGTGQQNVVAIVAQGSTFNLYVNDLTKVTDSLTDNANTFTQGSIGLLASDFANPTSVLYTDALVWTQ